MVFLYTSPIPLYYGRLKMIPQFFNWMGINELKNNTPVFQMKLFTHSTRVPRINMPLRLDFRYHHNMNCFYLHLLSTSNYLYCEITFLRTLLIIIPYQYYEQMESFVLLVKKIPVCFNNLPCIIKWWQRSEIQPISMLT